MIEPQRIYAWWIEELSKTLTPRRKATRAWKTLLTSTSGGLEIQRMEGSASVPVGFLPAGADADESAALAAKVSKSAETQSKDVLLRLSTADVVERLIQIPKAAGDVIDPVVRNQLERILPWPEDEMRFGYRVVGPNAKAPAQLDVCIVATSRKILDSIIATSRSLGLEPARVEFAPASQPDMPIELMSMEADPSKRTADILQAALVALFIGCVAIGGFGLYTVFDRQSQRNDLVDRIAMVSARVEANRRLNVRNAELRQQHKHLIGQKSDNPAVMMLIERLSQALPDSTYLTELELHGREARLLGKSDNPTALISVLEDTDEFEDVKFSAPTVHDENQSTETFSIVAKVNGGATLEQHR